MRDELDITRNIRLTGYLEADIISGISEMYKRIALHGDSGCVTEALADVIIKTYMLSDVLGIGYTNVDMKIKEILKRKDVNNTNFNLKGLLNHMSSARERYGA